jgi:integrase
VVVTRIADALRQVANFANHSPARGQSIRDLRREAGRHLVNLEKPWRRIRAAAKIDDVRLHDLRHSFASVAASGGQSLIVIGKMLGHSQPATTVRYAHLADDPVKAASDAVGRYIAAAMDGGTSGELVELPRSRRAARCAC